MFPILYVYSFRYQRQFNSYLEGGHQYSFIASIDFKQGVTDLGWLDVQLSTPLPNVRVKGHPEG